MYVGRNRVDYASKTEHSRLEKSRLSDIRRMGTRGNESAYSVKNYHITRIL